MGRQHSWRAVLIILVALCLQAQAGRNDTVPEPAIPALLRAFDNHSVVALGESHGSRAAGEFYLALVRTPGFSDHVNTIVLECANSLYQPILDRYMDGEDVPFEQLARVWRNTNKVLSWDSPIYENLIRGLREVNLKLPKAQRIRVLAADGPIDWSHVRNRKDYEDAPGGEEFFASLIEREVLAKNRKALLIMGANHVTRGHNWFGNDDVTSLLQKQAKYSVYVVLLWGISPSADPAIGAGPVPSLTPLQGTKLGHSDYLDRRAEDVADAYLYLGASQDMVPPDWNALQNDKVYWTELQRRHQIEFGCPLDVTRWKRHQKPCP